MLFYSSSTRFLFLFVSALSVEAGGCFSTHSEDSEPGVIETNPKRHPMWNKLMISFQVQNKTLLAESRITFAKEIDEIMEMFNEISNQTNHHQTPAPS
jgi:hypothetical protein